MNVLNNNVDIQAWNSTYIALIPKVKQSRLVSNYMPISLCNVSYKIITKSITNRLKIFIGLVISDSQSTFIPNQTITDNVIIGHECIHYIKNNKYGVNGLAAFKLDLSKTFDRVEWYYLECFMRKLGFADRWIFQIMRCLSTVIFYSH